MSHIPNYLEAVKRPDRLAQDLAHICRSIWEWIYAKQIAPLDTGGHGGGGGRGQTFKSLGKLSNGWADWHQLWLTSADSCGNLHRLNPSRPYISPGALGGGGGVGGHTFKSLGKLSNGCTDWHRIWYTSADSSGNGHLYINLRKSRDCICVSVAAGRCGLFCSLFVRAASFTYFGEVLRCPHKRIVTITKVYIARNAIHVEIIRFHTN